MKNVIYAREISLKLPFFDLVHHSTRGSQNFFVNFPEKVHFWQKDSALPNWIWCKIEFLAANWSCEENGEKNVKKWPKIRPEK